MEEELAFEAAAEIVEHILDRAIEEAFPCVICFNPCAEFSPLCFTHTQNACTTCVLELRRLNQLCPLCREPLAGSLAAVLAPQCASFAHLHLDGPWLAQCASLVHLQIDGPGKGIGDEGAGRLAAVLAQCASLAHLDLSQNLIGAEGAGSLAAVLAQ